nr:RNA-directed DNA polymerase, eukaryota, reverse transcriptase zinc-binding domain protein [Tanacetum cinerariifolium]
MGGNDDDSTSGEEATNITKQKVAAAKKYIENHYKEQMKNLQERRERNDTLSGINCEENGPISEHVHRPAFCSRSPRRRPGHRMPVNGVSVESSGHINGVSEVIGDITSMYIDTGDCNWSCQYCGAMKNWDLELQMVILEQANVVVARIGLTRIKISSSESAIPGVDTEFCYEGFKKYSKRVKFKGRIYSCELDDLSYYIVQGTEEIFSTKETRTDEENLSGMRLREVLWILMKNPHRSVLVIKHIEEISFMMKTLPTTNMELQVLLDKHFHTNSVDATLITSVLGALGTYYFSLFPMPSLVNKKLETLRANFFWGNGVNSHKIHWISWNVALASKEKGGLGFGSLFALNHALILKWRWRFLNNPNALWACLIVVIHGHNTESTSFFSHIKIKGVWSRIVGSINRLHEKNIISLSSMKRHVNNGATTKFWHDVWAGSASFKSLFPRLFHLAVNKDCFVRDNWINGWSFDWVRNIISGPNASQLALLQNTISAFTLNDSEDSWAWTVGNVEDKIIVPKPPKNCARCARCGHQVNGPYCQGCTFFQKKLEEDLVTHFQGFQNTSESSDDSTNVVNAPLEPFVVKQDHENALGDGEACQRCTCKRCGGGLSKGLCLICGNNQNSPNDSPSISANSSHNPPHIDERCFECGDALDGIFCQRCACKSCGKGAHIGYNCPPKVQIISIWNRAIKLWRMSPRKLCQVLIQCAIPKKKIHHLAFQNLTQLRNPLTFSTHLHNLLYTLVNFAGAMLDMVTAELAEYINTPGWNRPAFYNNGDDDDVDYTIAITPGLSTEEPDNSLTKDHFEIVINSNDDYSSSDDDSLYYENIEYVEASPYDSELVSLEVEKIVIPEDEEIEDDSLREKLLKVNLLTAEIEALKDNLTPSSEFLTNGSTTTHSDISLSEYDSFIFDLSNDQFPPTDRSDFTHEEFGNKPDHIISPPEYDCLYFRNLPDPGEWIFSLNPGIRENLSFITCVNLPVEDDHSPLLAYVVWIFLAYLTYLIIPPHLHSFENEDTIFDPGITINRFYSSKPGLSHRDYSCSKGNVEDKILVLKPPKNCARCGHPVNGPYCQGCTFLQKKLKEDLVTHFQGFQNTFESSDDSTNVVNAPLEPFVVKQDHRSFVDKIICGLNKAPDSPHLHTFSPIQFHCFYCKDALGDGEACQRCTCKRCGSDLSKGLCLICGNNQNSPNDSPSISANSSHNPPHIDERCFECGDALDGIFCQRCAYKSCGKGAHIGYNCEPKVPIISNLEPCNQTMKNEPPQTLPSFDPMCYSKKENSSPCVSKPNSVEGPLTFSTYLHNLLYTLVNFAGAMLDMVTAVHLKFCFDQTQPPQSPIIHPPPQETSIEIWHDQEKVINSVQTFLKKFNRYSFFETPKVLLLAWDRVFKIKDSFGNEQYKPEDVQELFHQLLNDMQNIHEELAENLPDSGEWISSLNLGIRENLSSTTCVNLPVEDDHSPLLAYVVWIFLAYLTYLVIPPHLRSFENKDTIFDPGITINRFYSSKPGLSHRCGRCGTFKKFNTHRSHLNESPMEMLFSTLFPMDQ